MFYTKITNKIHKFTVRNFPGFLLLSKGTCKHTGFLHFDECAMKTFCNFNVFRWSKVFKSGLGKFFKGYLPQNLLSPLLNSLSHMFLIFAFWPYLQNWKINETEQKNPLNFKHLCFQMLYCYLQLLLSIVFPFLLKCGSGINIFSQNGN